MEDAGVYKCRVDFRESQTVIRRVRLNIVEEPEKPVILDEEGSAVMGNLESHSHCIRKSTGWMVVDLGRDDFDLNVPPCCPLA